MTSLIEQLEAALGRDAVLRGAAALEVRDAAQTHGLGAELGVPLAVLRPRSTAEVSLICPHVIRA